MAEFDELFGRRSPEEVSEAEIVLRSIPMGFQRALETREFVRQQREAAEDRLRARKKIKEIFTGGVPEFFQPLQELTPQEAAPFASAISLAPLRKARAQTVLRGVGTSEDFKLLQQADRDVQQLIQLGIADPSEYEEALTARLEALKAARVGRPAAPRTAQQPSPRIRVREKSSGDTGTLPASEFDPARYERL